MVRFELYGSPMGFTHVELDEKAILRARFNAATDQGRSTLLCLCETSRVELFDGNQHREVGLKRSVEELGQNTLRIRGQYVI